mmetsp:Transcript_10929/g.28009  ORF Transcript_10929/g.28009 Transcript_10929/m.28009 type:complete len:237 (-) Transcript_10929:23-733(-)
MRGTLLRRSAVYATAWPQPKCSAHATRANAQSRRRNSASLRPNRSTMPRWKTMPWSSARSTSSSARGPTQWTDMACRKSWKRVFAMSIVGQLERATLIPISSRIGSSIAKSAARLTKPATGGTIKLSGASGSQASADSSSVRSTNAGGKASTNGEIIWSVMKRIGRWYRAVSRQPAPTALWSGGRAEIELRTSRARETTSLRMIGWRCQRSGGVNGRPISNVDTTGTISVIVCPLP